MAEPRSVTAGDSWSWTRALADYPASAGWTLTYYLSLGPAAPKTITCTADGDNHVATVAATASDWAPGDYHWTSRVEKDGELHTADSGVLTVQPDPSATVDRRTHAEKCLAAVTAVLEGRTGDSIAEYEIDGVKAKHLAPADLLRLRGFYLRAVRRERGLPTHRVIPVRFDHV